MEITKSGTLVVNYKDLADLKRNLDDGVDLNLSISSLFYVHGIDPSSVQDVEFSTAPSRDQIEFVEMVIQAIKDYVRQKKNQ